MVVRNVRIGDEGGKRDRVKILDLAQRDLVHEEGLEEDLDIAV